MKSFFITIAILTAWVVFWDLIRLIKTIINYFKKRK